MSAEKTRERSIIRTSFIGILGNLLLVAAKAIIGVLAHSASIISDAINNLSDALSSLITIVGTKLSGKKPDKKHPFGYGRIEYLTATVVAALILFAGGTAIYESIVSLVNGDRPQYDWIAFMIIGIGIGVKLLLGLFFRFQGKKLTSGALKNSGTDALFDALLSAATLVAALVSHFTGVFLEGYAGILIGLFIIRSGILAMRDAISPLLGDRIDDVFAREFKAEVCSHPGVKGAYDFIVNSYGEGRSIGSIHIEVDDNMSAKEIFALEREIQAYAMEKYHIFLTVGIYASNDSDPVAAEIKSKLLGLVHENKEILQCHGFYFDEERELVSFDLIIDFKARQSQQAIAASIKGKLEEQYPKLRFYVNLDQDFSS